MSTSTARAFLNPVRVSMPLVTNLGLFARAAKAGHTQTDLVERFGVNLGQTIPWLRQLELKAEADFLGDLWQNRYLGGHPNLGAMPLDQVLDFVRSEVQRALPQGEIPTETTVSEEWRAQAETRLRDLGFEGVQVPAVFRWKAAGSMLGVAHGKPLFVEVEPGPQQGTVVIPIYQLEGAPYLEHFHGPAARVGVEKAIFFPESGPLTDVGGVYATTDTYVQLLGGVHTPVAGPAPAMYLGVANVVLTGMPGTLGADLLGHFGIGAAVLLDVMKELPPDSREAQPRTHVMRCLLEDLLRIFLSTDPDNRQAAGDHVDWLQRLGPTARATQAKAWLQGRGFIGAPA